jgi:hypothetical protein
MSGMAKLLHTRIPTVLFLAGFTGAIAMMIRALVGAEDPGYATPDVIRNAVLWGGVSLVMMLGFCLCLAVVTRHKRSPQTFADIHASR